MKTRFFLVDIPQGISGFPKPSMPALVTDKYMKNHPLAKPQQVQLGNLSTLTWRWNDGHLPEYQPTGTLDEAVKFLQANPYSYATPV